MRSWIEAMLAATDMRGAGHERSFAFAKVAGRSARATQKAATHKQLAPDHMIAVGGAGSSGLPALARGTRTIARINTASAAKASQKEGVQ